MLQLTHSNVIIRICKVHNLYVSALGQFDVFFVHGYKVTVHMQHKLKPNDNAILPCELVNYFLQPLHSYENVQTEYHKMMFQNCLTVKPFFTCVAIWLFICHLMCLHNSCRLFHTFFAWGNWCMRPSSENWCTVRCPRVEP